MSKGKREPKVSLPNLRLRDARVHMGLSQQDVAQAIELPDPHTIGRWETGKSFPRAHYRKRLSELLGKSLEDLGLIPLKDQAHSQSTHQAGEQASFSIDNTEETLTYRSTIKPSFTSFIGREEAIRRVCRLLAQPEVRLLTLLGAGGVGKTRLASEVAEASRSQFAENICMVALASLHETALVLPVIAREIQVHERDTRTLLADVQHFFNKRSDFLLILDNFEHLIEAGSIIEALLAGCPRLKVLVTSRSVLHIPGEREFTLHPLPLAQPEASSADLLHSPALQLFIQRAQARLDDFEATPENLPVIGDICAALDGLPLAIELAAARVKLFSLPALRDEIAENRLHLHNPQNAAQGLSPRQRTLADTIKWSYDLLDEREQWLVRHLAVFPGGCTLPATRKLWGVAAFQDLDALSILMSLLDKSMVRPVAQENVQPRFLMLETIREYCLELLRQQGELEATREMLASYCLELLATAEGYLKGPQQATWLEMLDQERQNLTAALAWLVQSQQSERALLFCEVFGKFCGLRGYWSEEAHWTSMVLELSKTVPGTQQRGRVLRRAAHLAYRMRDLPRAHALFEESCSISKELGDTTNLAGALSGLAWVYYREQNITQVPFLLEESVAAARASGNRWSLSNALESQSRFLLHQGRIAEATSLMEESLTLARAVEDGENLVRLLHTSIAIELTCHRFSQAAALAQESFQAAKMLGNKPLIALALDGLAETALAQGDLEKATDLYTQRMQLAHELQDAPAVALMTLKLSTIALKQTKFTEAEQLAQTSLSFFQKSGDWPNITIAEQTIEQIARQRVEKKS